MQDVLHVLAVPGGYSPYVLVGWVEVKGLELVVHGARVIRRFGQGRSIAELAAEGPATDTQLLPASEFEQLWRPNVSRALPANAKAWKKECPRPAVAAFTDAE